MPKVIKKKTARPAKKEDIKTIIGKTKRFTAGKNQYLIAMAVIILSIAAIFIYRNTVSRKAENLQYEGYKIYYGLYQTQPVPDKDRYDKALQMFQKAYEAKKSAFSLYYMANCYYSLQRYDDAMLNLKELNRVFPDDERFVPLTYYKMAMISLKKGAGEDALRHLETLYNYKTASYEDLSLIEAGRILEGMGRKEEAKKKYEMLIKDFSDSPFAGEAESRLKKRG